MFVTLLRLTALLCPLLALVSQVDRPLGQEIRRSPTGTAAGQMASAEITAEDLEVFDEPDEASFVTGTLKRGDHVGVRGAVVGGWLSIDPPPMTICWIARSAIDPDADAEGTDGRVIDSARPGTSAEVLPPGAVIRFGHPQARMPGPPRGRVSAGTIVRLARRPPLEIGQGRAARVWYAIEPPPDQCCYIRADLTRPVAAMQPPAAETQPALVAARYAPPGAEPPRLANLPAGVASEIEKLEATEQTILALHPIEEWRFDPVRSRFQALLKAAGDNPAVEEAIRTRLARVTHYEQAAQAARQIQAILAVSHGRDREVVAVRRRIAAAGRSRARAFQVVGYMQPCSQSVEGRKLYVLISNNGSTLAYLDIPPGLDPDPLLASRVGVRGVAHYNEDLGAARDHGPRRGGRRIKAVSVLRPC